MTNQPAGTGSGSHPGSAMERRQQQASPRHWIARRPTLAVRPISAAGAASDLVVRMRAGHHFLLPVLVQSMRVAAGLGASGAAAPSGLGSRFSFDGEVVEVTGFEGTRVTLRDARDRWRTLGLAGFLARAVPLEAPQGQAAPPGPLLSGLSAGEQSAVAGRAGHVREVLTGYRSGTAEAARPGEPRPDYDPARPLGGRQEAKARELGVTGRTIRRWVRAYRDGGEAGLADARRASGRRLELDPRWEEACRTVAAGQVTASTPTAGALLRLIDAQLDDQYGAGAVPRPSTATAYRHLARLTHAGSS